MKTNFKKTTIALVMLIFGIAVSCNKQSNDVMPNSGQPPVNQVVQSDENLLINRLKNDSVLREMSDAKAEMENHILNGQMKRLIKDEKGIKEWKARFANAKSETEINRLLAEMYNEPQLMINVQKAAVKFFNKKNIEAKFPELLRLSNIERGKLLSKAFPLRLKTPLKNARVSDCYGTCSNQLNIDLGQADAQFGADLISAGLNLDIFGIWQAVISWEISYEAAISSFDNCWMGCDSQG